ncbi:MAG: hypothetical protein HYX71_10075 [Opitutae bacterium]|nr:hypothetical protein [Opitutae bacterium]
MIIWRGLGILVAIAGFAGFIIAETISRSVTHDTTYYQTHALPKLGGAVLGALLAFGMTKALAKGNAPRTVVDKETGKEMQISRGDSFFFVPSKYIPYVVLGIGVIVALIPG